MSDRMSDMDPRDAEIDRLLRRSMAAPVPALSPDFHQVLSRELRLKIPTAQFLWPDFARQLRCRIGGDLHGCDARPGARLDGNCVDDACSPFHA